eukprot:4990345-Pyramimonas_sp.AAC.1
MTTSTTLTGSWGTKFHPQDRILCETEDEHTDRTLGNEYARRVHGPAPSATESIRSMPLGATPP